MVLKMKILFKNHSCGATWEDTSLERRNGPMEGRGGKLSQDSPLRRREGNRRESY